LAGSCAPLICVRDAIRALEAVRKDGPKITAGKVAGKRLLQSASRSGRFSERRAPVQAAIQLGGKVAVEITMKELLEAGVHFGHQTRRWNPKMKEYIFGERNGIHIIDLQKTLKMFREASRFVSDLSAQGRSILFVGTKRQAQEAVAEEARRCGAYFVNHRWLGGTLTNWATLQKSIKRLKLLKAMTEDGRMEQLSKKERARLDREMKHLQQNLEGIENMTQLPDAMFVIDSNAEEIAVKEARRMGVPVVSVVDTNCDPDVVDWIIPGNDDALRAIRLFTSKMSESVSEGRVAYEQSQVADQKAASDQALEEGVEYVDTSAYEQYEKQEGDFVEGAEESAAAPAKATVPPDDAQQ
jgi:small subunit ribosomal protein S2